VKTLQSPPMDTTHPSLLVRIRDRADNRAWTQFKHLYDRLLRSYIGKRSQTLGLPWRDQQIEEVVHDVFVHLWFKLPDFELNHGIGRFRTYLWRIVTNYIADLNPHRKRDKADAIKKEQTGASAGTFRPDVLDEGQVDFDRVKAPNASEPDDPWLDEFHKTQLRIVLDLVKEETARANPKKWQCFEKQWLGGSGAGAVAQELGVSSDLVYQNSSRVFKDVCARFKEEFGEELAV